MEINLHEKFWDKKKEIKKLSDVVIKTESDIFNLIAQIKNQEISTISTTLTAKPKDMFIGEQGDPKEEGRIVMDDFVNAQVFESNFRNVLIQGIKEAENARGLISQDISGSEFGGFNPAEAQLGARTWVDTIIEKRLGAKRDGSKIIWHIDGSRYVFDPQDCTLEKE